MICLSVLSDAKKKMQLRDEKEMTCTCKEIKDGGNICHSNDGCECQLFGDFDDPVFCGEDELKDLEKKRK